MQRPMHGRMAYANSCRFCFGKGCFDCDVKSDRAMEASFNNPLTFRLDSPEDMERMKSLLHADVISTPEGMARIHEAFAEQARSKNGDEAT